MKVLLVDDDFTLLDVLGYALQRADFEVLTTADAPAALDLLEHERPDVMVIDINLGPWNGLDLLRDVRRRSQVPVIMLTGRAAEDDKVRGLELGADDYVTKPFGHRELVARIHAVMRRFGHDPARAHAEPAVLEGGPVVLDTNRHAVTLNGERISLTVTEFRLLHYLMIHADRVAATVDLLRQVWGHRDPSGNELVRTAIYRLRRKLNDDPNDPRLIHTIPGVGFMFHTEPDDDPPGTATDERTDI